MSGCNRFNFASLGLIGWGLAPIVGVLLAGAACSPIGIAIIAIGVAIAFLGMFFMMRSCMETEPDVPDNYRYR